MLFFLKEFTNFFISLKDLSAAGVKSLSKIPVPSSTAFKKLKGCFDSSFKVFLTEFNKICMLDASPLKRASLSIKLYADST